MGVDPRALFGKLQPAPQIAVTRGVQPAATSWACRRSSTRASAGVSSPVVIAESSPWKATLVALLATAHTPGRGARAGSCSSMRSGSPTSIDDTKLPCPWLSRSTKGNTSHSSEPAAPMPSATKVR